LVLRFKDHKSPSQFVAEVTTEMIRCLPSFRRALRGVGLLPKSLLGFLKDNISEIGLFEFKLGLRERVGKDWDELGKILLKQTAKLNEKVILMLDELPLMISRILKGDESDTIEPFLFWLRSLREGSEAMRNVRFIIGGSIGIEHVLSKADAVSSMNDLEKIRVDPFPLEVAKNLVMELFKSENFEVGDDVVNQVLKEVEIFVPFFLQLLVSEVSKMAKFNRIKIDPSLVSKAYKDALISVESRTYFESFYSRLKDYYEPDEERATKEMLKHLALKGRLTIRELRNISLSAVNNLSDDDFSHLLGDLENDFYLKREDDSYIFHTKVLRDWWIRFYAF
jgi:hypothetical protein